MRLTSQINEVNKRIINRLSEFVKPSFRALDLRRSGLSDGLWVAFVFIQWIRELRFWKIAGQQNMRDNKRNRIYNRILDRDWFSARLFVT